MLCSVDDCEEIADWRYKPDNDNGHADVISPLCHSDTEALIAFGEPQECFIALPEPKSKATKRLGRGGW